MIQRDFRECFLHAVAPIFMLMFECFVFRYKYQLDSVEQMVMDTITEQMTKRQHIEIASKQLLRLLTSVTGYCAVRLLVITKLDIWLQNPKVSVPQTLMFCPLSNMEKKLSFPPGKAPLTIHAQRVE